jgi:hypothetical protein
MTLERKIDQDFKIYHDTSNIFIHIDKLPSDIINIIKGYIPKKSFIFTNRENYNLYHSLLKEDISNIDNYIRTIVKFDYSFIFQKVLRENFKKWIQIKNYKYKDMIFVDYFHFITNYCIENESSNCRKNILIFLKEHGLNKNLYKKKFIKYIKWKN